MFGVVAIGWWVGIGVQEQSVMAILGVTTSNAMIALLSQDDMSKGEIIDHCQAPSYHDMVGINCWEGLA